ncbi:MAG: primosomal protein N', partial [Acetobacter sp.]
MPDDPASAPPVPEDRTPHRVPVLLPLPFAGPFDYKVPPHLPLALGDIVSVPLGNRRETGVVWETASLPADLTPTDTQAPVAASRLRAVAARLDLPPLPAELRRFVDWVAAYTLSPPGMVLAMTLRLHMHGTTTPATGWLAVAPPPDTLRMTPARLKVLALLDNGTPRSTTDLASAAGVSAGVVKGLADAGALRPVQLGPERP